MVKYGSYLNIYLEMERTKTELQSTELTVS